MPSKNYGLFSEEVKKEFGRRVLAKRIEKGWNQSEVARQAQLHMPKGKFGRDSISSYERGSVLPTQYSLLALAKVFDCEPDDLLPGYNRSFPAPSVQEEIETAPISMQSLKDGFAHLRVNMRVPFDIALKIMQLLDGVGLDRKK